MASSPPGGSQRGAAIMKNEFVTKQDLGIAYFPHMDSRCARQKLCEIIHEDCTLYRKLVKTGYKKTSKSFTPNQTALIYDRLGKPY